MKLKVLTDTTVGVSIGPLEGFGAFVVGLDIAGDSAGEVGLEVKMPQVIKSRRILEKQIST